MQEPTQDPKTKGEKERERGYPQVALDQPSPRKRIVTQLHETSPNEGPCGRKGGLIQAEQLGDLGVARRGRKRGRGWRRTGRRPKQ